MIGKFETPLEAAHAQDAYVVLHHLESENKLNFMPEVAAGATTAAYEDKHDYDCAVCSMRGDLVCCDGCTKVYHVRCVPALMRDGVPDGDWFCPSCDASKEDKHDYDCAVCSMRGDLVCCDGCTKVYHVRCVPALMRDGVPDGDWFCPSCDASKGLEGEKDEGEAKARTQLRRASVGDTVRIMRHFDGTLICRARVASVARGWITLRHVDEDRGDERLPVPESWFGRSGDVKFRSEMHRRVQSSLHGKDDAYLVVVGTRRVRDTEDEDEDGDEDDDDDDDDDDNDAKLRRASAGDTVRIMRHSDDTSICSARVASVARGWITLRHVDEDRGDEKLPVPESWFGQSGAVKFRSQMHRSFAPHGKDDAYLVVVEEQREDSAPRTAHSSLPVKPRKAIKAAMGTMPQYPHQVWSRRDQIWTASVRRLGAPKKIGEFASPIAAALAQDAYVRAHQLQDENVLNFKGSEEEERPVRKEEEEEEDEVVSGRGRRRKTKGFVSSSSSSSSGSASSGRMRRKKVPAKAKRRESSRYRGVSLNHGKKWQVGVVVEGRRAYLGSFTKETAAARAYDAFVISKKLQRHLNFPDARTAKHHKLPVTLSRHRGVSWHKNSRKWLATLRVGDIQSQLGRFTDEDAAARAYDSAVRKRGLDRHLNFPAEADRDEDEDANISSNVKAAKKPTSSSSVSGNEHDDEDKEAENSSSKADSSDQSPHFHHEVPSTVGTERVVDTDDGTTYWRAVVTTPSTGRVHYVKNDHGDQQTGNERFATEVSEWVSNLRVSRHVAYIF